MEPKYVIGILVVIVIVIILIMFMSSSSTSSTTSASQPISSSTPISQTISTTPAPISQTISTTPAPISQTIGTAVVSTPITGAYPPGLTEGEVVRCASDGAIYLLQNGTKCHYTANGYASAGNPAFTGVDCSILASIPDGATIGT